MRYLSLPVEDETKLNITIGESNIEVDILDIDRLHYEAIQARDKYDSESDVYSYFCPMFKDAYGVSISKYAASRLLTVKNELNQELKKKYTPSSDPDDSTDTDQETTESSTSSDS